MKLLKIGLPALLSIALVYSLNRSWNLGAPIPPLGKFLDPFHGFWQNAETGMSTNSERSIPGITGKVTVIYDRRVASSLLGHLSSAINGAAIARGTSFLKNKMGQQIFAKGISVIDDPLRRRGLASRPFDGEGLSSSRRELVADGTLTGWVLDLRSARQLGFTPTGNGSRGLSSPPGTSTSNLHLEPGQLSPEQMIGSLKQGLYITELIGNSVNMVTGDYSRGASGFWIENGQLAFPVSEITIAGNLGDMFMTLEPANDLIFKSSTNAPTCRVEGLTIAGT